jgi:uncharacterized delta-60 repeat protein
MARVHDVVISLGLPCVSAVLLMAQAVAAQPCVPLSSTPGSLDTCFGVNGYVETDVTGTGDFQGVQAIRVQSDGKIVVGAYSRVLGSTGTELFLERYVPDGSALDLTFGGTGIVKTPLTTSGTDSEILKGLAIQLDGKIVVAAQMPPTSKKGAEAFAVLRYNVDGTLDGTFGSGGVVVFGFANGADAYARTIAVDGSGRIVVAGESGSVLAVARLTPSGAFDSTFGAGGRATFAAIGSESTYATAIDGAGRPLFAGGLGAVAYVARLTTSGALDTSFAGKGWATFAPGNQTDYFTALAVDPAGKIVAGGRATTVVARKGPFYTDMLLARLLPNGGLDPSFGNGGVTTQDINGTFDVIHGLAIETDGHVIVCAEATATDYTSSDTAVSRFNSNGSLDTAFGLNGFTLTNYPFAYAFPYGLAVQNDNGVMKAVVLEGLNQSRLVGLTRYLW